MLLLIVELPAAKQGELIEFGDRRESEMLSGGKGGLQLTQLVIELRAAPVIHPAPSTMIAPFFDC